MHVAHNETRCETEAIVTASYKGTLPCWWDLRRCFASCLGSQLSRQPRTGQRTRTGAVVGVEVVEVVVVEAADWRWAEVKRWLIEEKDWGSAGVILCAGQPVVSEEGGREGVRGWRRLEGQRGGGGTADNTLQWAAGQGQGAALEVVRGPRAVVGAIGAAQEASTGAAGGVGGWDGAGGEMSAAWGMAGGGDGAGGGVVGRAMGVMRRGVVGEGERGEVQERLRRVRFRWCCATACRGEEGAQTGDAERVRAREDCVGAAYPGARFSFSLFASRLPFQRPTEGERGDERIDDNTDGGDEGNETADELRVRRGDKHVLAVAVLAALLFSAGAGRSFFIAGFTGVHL